MRIGHAILRIARVSLAGRRAECRVEDRTTICRSLLRTLIVRHDHRDLAVTGRVAPIHGPERHVVEAPVALAASMIAAPIARLIGLTPPSPCIGSTMMAAVCSVTAAFNPATSSAATNVTVLDIDSAVASGDPYEAQKTQFAVAKELVELAGGDTEVLEKYHAGLVAPFCLSAVRSFFDGS